MGGWSRGRSTPRSELRPAALRRSEDKGRPCGSGGAVGPMSSRGVGDLAGETYHVAEHSRTGSGIPDVGEVDAERYMAWRIFELRGRDSARGPMGSAGRQAGSRRRARPGWDAPWRSPRPGSSRRRAPLSWARRCPGYRSSSPSSARGCIRDGMGQRRPVVRLDRGSQGWVGGQSADCIISVVRIPPAAWPGWADPMVRKTGNGSL